MKNWLAMLTLLKGRVMPNYVAGKDYKSRTERMFNPSESESMSKKTVVKKVIDKLIKTVITKIHGEYRRKHLTTALSKLTRDEILMLEMVFRKGADKEVEAHLSNCKEIVQ